MAERPIPFSGESVRHSGRAEVTDPAAGVAVALDRRRHLAGVEEGVLMARKRFPGRVTIMQIPAAAKSAAEMCRDNGWGPGTQLVGDEGYGPTVIEITAVGAHLILARMISRKGFAARYPGEQIWNLSYGPWERV